MRRVDMTTALAWQAIFGALCLGAGWLAASAPAIAQQTAPPDWPTEKCNRYKAAYELILKRQGKAGLGPEFLASHDAFLASNCQARAEVCARSPEEIDLANKLTLMAMNRGMSGTFLPFYCRS
ncbi:MAG: hypothetical protein ACTHP8_01290 [Bosea sp. (in: a-proteobacteria)]|uniref:hypothetical protein n=1 Tax=Bosea sp. (in: a-proteobacteria) TaxID=1871050 RepID=UPI003F7CB7EF